MSGPFRLWLFDVDGTLVDTAGAGLTALLDAAAECFGGTPPEPDLAGATDRGVAAAMLRHFERELEEAAFLGFYDAYLTRLEENLASGRFPVRLLPAAAEAVRAVDEAAGTALGLLTGNIEAGARAKVAHFGLQEFFPFGAFGALHEDRNLLGPLAMQAAAEHVGSAFLPEETVVVGDTPKDIACARAAGAACIAVATGRFSVDELREAGADLALADLRELLPLLPALCTGEQAG